MSLFNHFQGTVKETDASKLCDYILIVIRFVYDEKDKQDVAKYTAQCDTTTAIRKFKHRFPN